MKKFLTVLLVIAVMFTFSFGSAFAAYTVESGNYTYEQAVAQIEASAKLYLDKAAVLYNTATKAAKTDVTYTASFNTLLAEAESAGIANISVEARNAVYEDSYNDYVIAVKKNLSQALTAFAAAVPDKTADVAHTTIASYVVDVYDPAGAVGPVVDWAVPTNTTLDEMNAFLEGEFDVVKRDTLAGLNEIFKTLEGGYDDNTEVTTGKTSYDLAVENVEAAIDLVEGYEYTDLTATANADDAVNAELTANLALIANMKAIYVAPVGSGDPSGLIVSETYNNATDNLYADDFTTSGALKGLSDLTELNPLSDAAKLAYAKSNVLSTVSGLLTTEKNKAVTAITEDIISETEKGTKANQVTIDELNEDLANVNDYYNRAIEVITYLVNNAETVAELTTGAYTSTAGWAVGTYTDGATTLDEDTTFGALSIDLPAGLDLGTTLVPAMYTAGYSTTIDNLVTITKNVAKAKEDAAAVKAQILIDGTSYADIDDLLEDTIDDIYRGKATRFVANQTTDTRDYVFHYVEDTLIDTEKDEVTLGGVEYANIFTWSANLGDYDEEKQDDVKVAVKEAKAAVRAAATVEDANAAFLAGYAKWDAIPTAAEHKADFKYSTGTVKDKYEAVQKELAAYAAAKIASLTELKTLKNYGTIDLATFVAYYNTTNGGAFYNECFTVEELDAMLAEAKALVDGLKTETELEKEGAAIIAEIPAIAKATLADKEAILAVYGKYVDHNDYCDLMDSAEKIYNHKLETLVRELEQVEAKAINDAYKAIMKDNKVTVDEADAVAALRAAFNAYQAAWVDSEIIGSALIAADSLDAAIDESAEMDAVEGLLDNAQADAVVKMIGELPAEPTLEQVKAARAAFDALSRTAQDRVFHANGGVTYSKFVDAEKLTYMDQENAKAYLQDLSVKARSVKTAKGNVKVTVIADVDPLLEAGYDVEYKFYRSTKSNKGFGKAKKVSEDNVYTNTSGVKGTKYYYKAVIVVKDAEGEVVAKTPLKHCLYATRTWTK